MGKATFWDPRKGRSVTGVLHYGDHLTETAKTKRASSDRTAPDPWDNSWLKKRDMFCVNPEDRRRAGVDSLGVGFCNASEGPNGWLVSVRALVESLSSLFGVGRRTRRE